MNIEQEILEELKNVRAELAAMRSEYSISRVTHFENLPNDAVVGLDFVSYKFGVSIEAARRGRGGTDSIKRFREKPLQFLKKDVLAAFREMTKSPSEKAAEIRFRAKKPKLQRGKNNGKT